MAAVAHSPELVSLPCGSRTLRAYFHPAGAAASGEPAPAVIWMHGSEPDPGAAETLARFYGERGWALVVPHRAGHGRSPGEYPIGALREHLRAAASPGGVDAGLLADRVIALHEDALEQTRAAFEWTAAQPAIDRHRILVSGASHGGVQALLAAEADIGAAAYAAFAPAAMAWEAVPRLGDRLMAAVREARCPILLIQAANDYSLGPSEALGPELERKGEPNQSRVYPAYGADAQAGHGEFALEGTEVWGADLLRFAGRAGLGG